MNFITKDDMITVEAAMLPSSRLRPCTKRVKKEEGTINVYY